MKQQRQLRVKRNPKSETSQHDRSNMIHRVGLAGMVGHCSVVPCSSRRVHHSRRTSSQRAMREESMPKQESSSRIPWYFVQGVDPREFRQQLETMESRANVRTPSPVDPRSICSRHFCSHSCSRTEPPSDPLPCCCSRHSHATDVPSCSWARDLDRG